MMDFVNNESVTKKRVVVAMSGGVVCANTASVAIAGAKSKFSIPHTSGWKNWVATTPKHAPVACCMAWDSRPTRIDRPCPPSPVAGAQG